MSKHLPRFCTNTHCPWIDERTGRGRTAESQEEKKGHREDGGEEIKGWNEMYKHGGLNGGRIVAVWFDLKAAESSAGCGFCLGEAVHKHVVLFVHTDKQQVWWMSTLRFEHHRRDHFILENNVKYTDLEIQNVQKFKIRLRSHIPKFGRWLRGGISF